MSSGYYCVRCSFQTFEMNTMKNHLRRKKQCKPNLSDCPASSSVRIVQKKHICQSCDRSFTRKFNLTKHRHKCSRRMTELQAEVDELRKRPLASTINNTNNKNSHNDNSTTNNITNNNNITMINYSNTKDTFTREQVLGLLTGAKFMFHPIDMFVLNHCDENHPECRNVVVTNARTDDMHLFEDGKWRIVSKKDKCFDIALDNIEKAELILAEIDKPYTEIEEQAVLNSQLFHYNRYDGPYETADFVKRMTTRIATEAHRLNKDAPRRNPPVKK